MENKLKKEDYYTRCRDCGRFVSKDKWVRKNDPFKEWALCDECLMNYDDVIY